MVNIHINTNSSFWNQISKKIYNCFIPNKETIPLVLTSKGKPTLAFHINLCLPGIIKYYLFNNLRKISFYICQQKSPGCFTYVEFVEGNTLGNIIAGNGLNEATYGCSNHSRLSFKFSHHNTVNKRLPLFTLMTLRIFFTILNNWKVMYFPHTPIS